MEVTPVLVIQELLFDRARQLFVGERFTRCPSDVRLHNVGSWLRLVYGPAVDAAWSTTADGGNVLVGWAFAVPADWRPASGDACLLVAVPMLADTSGLPTASALDEHTRRGANARRASRADGAQYVVCLRKKGERRRLTRPANASGADGRGATLRGVLPPC